jgi:hypothetical protein
MLARALLLDAKGARRAGTVRTALLAIRQPAHPVAAGARRAVRRYGRSPMAQNIYDRPDFFAAYSQLIEWSPSPDQVAADPALAEERDRPMFLLIAADAGDTAEKPTEEDR